MNLRRVAVLMGALLVLPVLAACGSSSSASSSDAAAEAVGPAGGEGFVGPEWKLQSAAINSVALSGFGITIAFTDTDVSGMSGVNRYAGTFTSGPDGDMDFGALAGTKMAGPEDAMKAEAAYLAALDTVTGYTVTSTELDLFAGDQEILTYTS